MSYVINSCVHTIAVSAAMQCTILQLYGFLPCPTAASRGNTLRLRVFPAVHCAVPPTGRGPATPPSPVYGAAALSFLLAPHASPRGSVQRAAHSNSARYCAAHSDPPHESSVR